jgi:tetratricopeptide (TPR) repeat protein
VRCWSWFRSRVWKEPEFECFPIDTTHVINDRTKHVDRPVSLIRHLTKQKRLSNITHRTQNIESLTEVCELPTIQAMDIIAVNNNAVNLMQQGCFQEAIPFFLSALREFHRIAGVQKQNMNMEPIDDDSTVSRPFVREVRSVPLGDSLSYLKPSIYQDQDAFSIFDRAFLIDSSDLASIYSSEGQTFTTPVLLYNMGLAYQLLGMEDLRSQHSNLKKAMKAYRMAAAIANDLVSLAVSNNKGHIYSQFCDTQESQRCLDSLQAGLQAIQQDSKVEILEDEFSAFQMNVLIMHGQKKVAASAA